MTALSDDELDRYARHLVLREVGGAGQARLKAARVLVVGAGGLGAPLCLYLAAAGVGTIGLVDDDRVSLSNLQRQILYGTEDVGRPKTEAARATLARINPLVAVVPHALRLTPDNARGLIADYDLVADGCDNFATRLAVNAACVALKKPLVSAAVGQFEGQLGVFHGHRPGEPCYQCFTGPDPRMAANCAEAGILGAVAGVVGTLQAVEVLKLILGLGEPLSGRLLLWDALDARSRVVRLKPDPACAVCGPMKTAATASA